MSLVLRLSKEFWLPALVAVIWTGINLHSASGQWGIREIVNVFGPSFFLASWATGQFFRVRKQTLVENNLTAINQRLETVVAGLERSAKDFAGYTLGEGGRVSFVPLFDQSDTGFIQLALRNGSDYPVFDIQSEVIDLDESVDLENGKLWTRQPFFAHSLYPNKIIMAAYRIDIRRRNRLWINVFVQTRSGGLTQQIRVDNRGNTPLIAMRTMSGEDQVELKVPDGFPGYDPENPAVLFS